MSYVDKTLTCRECGRQFSFTAGEQEFYASRGLQHEPGRCPECRAARKAAAGGATAGSAGGYADRGYGDHGGYGDRGGYSDRGGYGDRSSSYGAPRGPRQMYTAVCSSCGGEAQVPFQPTSGKPVYCSDCFAKQRAARF
jgi:CxxC-x17-CxxC domain-containing protein